MGRNLLPDAAGSIFGRLDFLRRRRGVSADEDVLGRIELVGGGPGGGRALVLVHLAGDDIFHRHLGDEK